jgi:hypothetical protein
VFRTLKLVYGLNEDVVVSKPGLFEEKLTDLIGERSADLALGMITDTIRKEIAFSRIAEIERS